MCLKQEISYEKAQWDIGCVYFFGAFFSVKRRGLFQTNHISVWVLIKTAKIFYTRFKIVAKFPENCLISQTYIGARLPFIKNRASSYFFKIVGQVPVMFLNSFANSYWCSQKQRIGKTL